MVFYDSSFHPQMLILLYSDTNFAMKGFRAEYSVSACPLNCSKDFDRGHCDESR